MSSRLTWNATRISRRPTSLPGVFCKRSPIVFYLVLAIGLLVGADRTDASDDPANQQRVQPAQVLWLGPLPVPPPEAVRPPLHGQVDMLPENPLAGAFPRVDQKVSLTPGVTTSWQRESVDKQGAVMLPGGGVHWIAVRLQLDRWAQLDLEVDAAGGLALYVDGELKDTRQDATHSSLETQVNSNSAAGAQKEPEAPEPLTARLQAARGAHTVFVRIELPAGLKARFPCRLTASTEAPTTVRWSVDPRTAPADFEQSRQMVGIGSLVVAPEGKFVARRVSRREPNGERRRSSVSVFDAAGDLVASEIGGGSARPVAFTPDARQLLLTRSGDEGTDLLLWNIPAGPARTVVRDEPGLGLVRMDPAGRWLMFASTRGVEPDEVDAQAARRRQHAREKVSDYTPHPHLHLVDLQSGMRRRLTLPGDHVLDDAEFAPDGKSVIYGITVPRPDRPWFHTEIRRIDLATGRDERVTTFVAGWEVRPQSFAISPDGKQLAFIGPPEEIGGGQREHNVYNKQVWLLDLGEGSCERITRDLPFAFAGGGNLPGWEAQGRSLLLVVDHGARRRLARLMSTRDGWTVETLAHGGDVVGSAALSRDGQALAYTVSSLTTPAELRVREVARDGDRLLEQPNAHLNELWLLSSPEDATCTGPAGDTVEAWWYPPTVKLAEGKVPLVLYYYGGSSPTSRGFNFTHQYFAANGYAVLVVNPRGAYGYGDTFADHHAGDWGPAASADILAAVDALLAARPEIDGDRIGIYGGSYGGFMTLYLITETDRFAAAVSLYGISDLATYWGQGIWGWTYGDMALAGVTPWSNPDLFVQKSPLYRADRVQTPLLLLHGLDDTNVTPGESEEMFTALAMQDKMVELVLFPGEEHGISGSLANRVQHRTMILEWFDRFLRDQPEAWDARWE